MLAAVLVQSALGDLYAPITLPAHRPLCPYRRHLQVNGFGARGPGRGSLGTFEQSRVAPLSPNPAAVEPVQLPFVGDQDKVEHPMEDDARLRTEPGRSTVLDCNGSNIGRVRHIYYDRATGRPEWLGVSTAWFRTKEHLVPVPDTFSVNQSQVIVDYDIALIKLAPEVTRGSRLDDATEQRLYEHYGFAPPSQRRFSTSSTPTCPLPPTNDMPDGVGGRGSASLRSRWLGRVAYGEAAALQQALFDSNRGQARLRPDPTEGAPTRTDADAGSPDTNGRTPNPRASLPAPEAGPPVHEDVSAIEERAGHPEVAVTPGATR